MVDESNNPQGRADTTASSGAGSAPVGYCQECGRALSVGSLQRTPHGVFCNVCAAQRQTAQGWQTVPAGLPPIGGRQAGMPPMSGDASPGLAGLLGLIPGVGAMYNGQYAKGAMHLIVFVVLVTLADNLNWVFYWLVWGWVFYQAFDAYHTARARRGGLPLPNPFGWNDIGERLGFNRTTPPVQPPFPGATGGFANPSSTRVGASWSGYVPPTAYAQAPPAPFSPAAAAEESVRPTTDNPYAAPYEAPARSYEPPPARPADPRATPYTAGVPYTPTYMGVVPPMPISPITATGRQRRFPIGAIWLIGLGIVFLLGNLMPGFNLRREWLVPLVLAAVAFWGAFRRWEQFRVASSTLGRAPNLPAAMTGPSVLLTVAVLLTLDAGNVLAMHRSWPVLLVVWGSMLLMQRAVAPALPLPRPEVVEAIPPPPVRSTSGTGSLGL